MDLDSVTTILKGENIAGGQLREVEAFDQRLSAKEFISTYPTYLLIRGDGQILYRGNEYSLVKNYISKNDLSK